MGGAHQVLGLQAWAARSPFKHLRPTLASRIRCSARNAALQPRRRVSPARRKCGIRAAAAAVPIAAEATTLLGGSTWGIWACLAAAGAAGLWAEKTRWGREMSGALLATLLGLLLSNTRIIPSDAPHVFGVVNAYLLPLAVPLLLLSADLRRMVRDTGRLLGAFALGAAATVAGSLLAFWLLPLCMLGEDGWKVAASLTARHIGGSVNYMAVSEALGLSPGARMAGLAADDLIVALYFVVLYALVRRVPPEPAPAAAGSTAGGGASSAGEDRRAISVLHASTALALSSALCFVGTSIAAAINYKGGAITVITALTVALATAAPRLLAPLTASGEGIAAILMQIFFAAVGASGDLATVIATAPALFAWSAISVFTHLALCLVWERLLGFSRRDVALASNANIGGPTTAAGMAAAKGWRSQTVPALLIGIAGYTTATFVGVASARVFQYMQFS